MEDNWPSSYPDTALALTSVTYDINGVIYDADIEMNGARFRFSDVEPGSLTSFYDVRSTLVHEVGHSVGLDHTRAETFVGSGDPEEATMHASSRPGETQKRVLTNDDIACFAEAYPFDVDTTSLLCAPNPDADFYRYVEAAEATGEGEHGELCVDGVDNDGDGLVDCVEPDCAIVLDCCTVEPCKTGRSGVRWRRQRRRLRDGKRRRVVDGPRADRAPGSTATPPVRLALALATLALLVPHPAQSADTGAAWVGHETVADEAHDGDAALTMGADGLVIAWALDTTPPRATAWRHVEGARGVARAGEGWVVFTLDERVVLDASLGELERTPLSAWLRCAGTPAAWSWDEAAGVVTLDHPAGISSEGAPRLPTEQSECRVALDGASVAWTDAEGRYSSERRGADWTHRTEAAGDAPVWPAGFDTRRGPRCAWTEDSVAPCVDRSGLGLLPRALEPALGWSDGQRWVAATHAAAGA